MDTNDDQKTNPNLDAPIASKPYSDERAEVEAADARRLQLKRIFLSQGASEDEADKRASDQVAREIQDDAKYIHPSAYPGAHPGAERELTLHDEIEAIAKHSPHVAALLRRVVAFLDKVHE